MHDDDVLRCPMCRSEDVEVQYEDQWAEVAYYCRTCLYDGFNRRKARRSRRG